MQILQFPDSSWGLKVFKKHFPQIYRFKRLENGLEKKFPDLKFLSLILAENPVFPWFPWLEKVFKIFPEFPDFPDRWEPWQIISRSSNGHCQIIVSHNMCFSCSTTWDECLIWIIQVALSSKVLPHASHLIHWFLAETSTINYIWTKAYSVWDSVETKHCIILTKLSLFRLSLRSILTTYHSSYNKRTINVPASTVHDSLKISILKSPSFNC